MDMKKLIESLSPNERKILPYIEEKSLSEICKKSNLDKVSAIRSLEYLKNKKIIKISAKKKKIIEIGVNGALYRKKGLPERRLLNLLDEKRILKLDEAQKESGLSNDEFKASIGALKRKALIELKNGKIVFNAKKEEISKKSPEESLIEAIPLESESLSPEQLYALKSLQNRKDIIEIKEEKSIDIEITDLGKKLIKSGTKSKDLIEQITAEILKKDSSWKGKKFRRYDVTLPVSPISGGKRHFVNQAVDHGRKVWTEMGFKEMTGNLVQSSFWNFDALFTAQDHPVRDIQDTFFIDKKIELPSKELVKKVKESHEKGISGSKGWGYTWDDKEAKKLVLRTHTTCLSAQTLTRLKEKDLPAKFFAIGANFRNETVDWNHGFELLQTEGIVVDPNANFRHLLGYLKQFAKKMGFRKIRFRPAYFPYTEPSVEGDIWNEERKEWVEYIAAGIFRPEVTEPLLGKPTPVLAWGPGFGRMVMALFDVKDIRDLNKNDLDQLRKMRFLMK
jgi:phenylalanyl-tRNA synthetase alpha chain